MAAAGSAYVVIVVVTYNSAGVLDDFFEALPDALEGCSSSSLVVVDNASYDDTVSFAQARDEVDEIVCLDENRGYAAGINAGVRARSNGDFYLVLNPDIRLGKRAVSELVHAAMRPGVGIAVPRLMDEHGQLLHSLRHRPSIGRSLGEAVMGGRSGRWSRFGETVRATEKYRRSTRADWATGGAMLIRRSCLLEAGGWDESFFLYEEEVDFALRAADAGYELRLQPLATAVRIIGSEGPSDYIWTLSRINKLRLYARRNSRTKAWVFWLVLILAEFLRLTTRRSRHQNALRELVMPFRFLDQLIQERLTPRPAAFRNRLRASPPAPPRSHGGPTR